MTPEQAIALWQVVLWIGVALFFLALVFTDHHNHRRIAWLAVAMLVYTVGSCFVCLYFIKPV